jgi:hypothetical protein
MKRRLFQTASLGLAMSAASPLLHAVVLAKDPPGGSPPIDFVPDNSPEPSAADPQPDGGRGSAAARQLRRPQNLPGGGALSLYRRAGLDALQRSLCLQL